MNSITNQEQKKSYRFGMVIDIDKCIGCGNCTVACATENNIPPAHPRTTHMTGITWIRVNEINNGKSFPETKKAFLPMLCQQCGHHPPCESVCPQKAVETDTKTGIVGQIPVRCLGCRYCMTACPYHSRYYNWWDPAWPPQMEKTLNPEVSVRMRGVVEKCTFCHQRYMKAKEQAAAQGKREIDPAQYIPACVESCPTEAIMFGDLNNETSEVSKISRTANTFRLLEKSGTEPKIYYHSRQSWVREMADHTIHAKKTGEPVNG